MKWYLKGFQMLLKIVSYQAMAQQIQKKGILLYLKTLQVVRKSMAAAVALFFILQLMVLGFVGSLVTGVWLLPVDDLRTKLLILLIVFASFFIIPAVLLVIVFSDRVWFKISGAEKLMEEKF